MEAHHNRMNTNNRLDFRRYRQNIFKENNQTIFNINEEMNRRRMNFLRYRNIEGTNNYSTPYRRNKEGVNNTKVYSYLKRNEQVRKAVNRHKNISDKLIKCKASITFLIRCRNAGIIPNFIKDSSKNICRIFHNNNLPLIVKSFSKHMQNFQTKILNLAIKEKHELLEQFKRELSYIKNILRRNFTDEEMTNFLKYNDKLTSTLDKKTRRIHINKFNCLINLQRKELGIKFNKKWFVNKSDVDVPKDVEYILSLGKKFALPIKKNNIPIMKVIADGEDIVQTLQDREEQEVARSKLSSIIDNQINRIKLNNRDKFLLHKVEISKKFLRNNNNIIILNADKGNTTVVMNKDDYVTRINNIIDDTTTYNIINKDPTNKLQKFNNDLVEELFKEKIITPVEKNKLKTNVALAPRLYGLPKIHKENFPLRPICSFINSPSYELCKYITTILKKYTLNSKYNVINSLHFKDRVKHLKVNDNEKLISLDVVSLFPSIPVNLAIDIIDEKWDNIKRYTNIRKELFLRIMKYCIMDNRYFQYNNKIYLQQKGLPMGSPASPIVADIVMEKLIDDCIEKLAIKPKILTKYVDDLFCIIPESEIENMLSIFNSFHKDIRFTVEKESKSRISYLDTLVIRKNNNLLIDWYQKPTSSGRIINYYSKHPKSMIINTAKNLIERILSISDNIFHEKNKNIITNILINNNFPVDLICKLIRQYNSRNTNTNPNVVLEQKIYKPLTYIPEMSERLQNSRIYDNSKYRIAHKIYNTIGQLFSKPKDKIQKLDKSNLVYKIPCNGNDRENCDKVYIGTTKNKLKTRISGHKSDQRYRNINAQRTALSSHCANLNHNPDFDNVSILNTENNYRRRYMLEMLQIINVKGDKRINFRTDTANLAHSYRYLLNKNKK